MNDVIYLSYYVTLFEIKVLTFDSKRNLKAIKVKTHLLPIFMWIVPCCLWSQSLHGDKFCEEADKIVIEESGIYAVSKDIFDTITFDARNNTVLYRYPDAVKSFWYKIYVAVDCKITFEIYPDNPDNRYNYFLYQQKGDVSIQEVYTTDIEPVRANLYKDKMKSGTGLSLSSIVSSNDSCPRNIGEIFYHTSYHSALTAKAGDVLLLNVYHLKGTDCGHHFVLKNNKYSQEFQSIYESCYNEQVVLKKVGHFFEPNALFVRSAPPGKAKGLFNVRDSIRQSNIDAEVACVKQCKEVNSTIHSETNGSYEVLLEKNAAYQITFSAFGYQNKTVSFFTTDTLASFTQEILLSLIKEGDGFVMDKIYFYPNTYAMKPGSHSQINQLAAYLNANPGIKIEIQGHTSGDKRIKKSYDNTEETVLVTEGRFRGSAKKLSQYRSELIKKQLVEKGVAADKLIANGYGGSKMIYPNPKNQEEANKNIRAGVLILSQMENVFPISSMSK